MPETIKFLIADDEDMMRIIIKDVLTDIDCSIVAEATNGQEAVDLFKETSPDLVLLDINMPEKSGIDALKEIKQISSKIPVLMLTSMSSMDMIEECFDLGIENYIRKDLDKEEIQKIIKTAIAKIK